MNERWLRKWLKGEPHLIIGGEDNPYLLRWFVWPRNRICNLYLHKFMRSDDDRALHDHPWWFASLILKGAYFEHTPEGLNFRGPRSFAYRRPEQLHRVRLLPDYHVYAGSVGLREKPCWTLFMTGPKLRTWGFACPQGWRPWQKFTEETPDGGSLGCGEYE